MTHYLGSGIVVFKDDTVLIVKQKNGWSLPKGGTEKGETFSEAAKREGFEETGLTIEVGNVAFITEFRSKKFGQYLQVYYSGSAPEQSIPKFNDPDLEVTEARFVPVKELRNFIKFRPWIIPLENWYKERALKFYSFDLDEEGFEV